LFVEAAAPAASGAGEQAGLCEFADVVVDSLAGKIHAAGDAGSGIGFEECSEDFEAERVVEEDGGLGVIAQEADGGGRVGDGGADHGRNLEWTILFVKNILVVNINTGGCGLSVWTRDGSFIWSVPARRKSGVEPPQSIEWRLRLEPPVGYPEGLTQKADPTRRARGGSRLLKWYAAVLRT